MLHFLQSMASFRTDTTSTSTIPSNMEVVDAQSLQYADFCARFLATNTPVKLRNVTPQWFPTAAAQWRCSHDGSINFEALKAKYGHAQVPVRLLCVVCVYGGHHAIRCRRRC